MQTTAPPALPNGKVLVYHGAVDEFRGRELVEPLHSRWIDGGYIPQDAVAAAAFRLSGDLRGEQVLRIPVLLGPRVGEPLQDRRDWGAEVGKEDRLPDSEDFDRGARLLRQKFLDCGGPPQTGASGRREQDNDARLV